MKPIDPPESLSVWVLASLSSTGHLTFNSPSSPSPMGTPFPGYFTSLEDAQQEQMLLALKGTRVHVYQLEFPRPV